MVITMKEDGKRFGARVGAIIYNEDKSKILLEKQKEMYMFPGGRIDVLEDSNAAINRELKEELNIKLDLKLKYICEMFLKSSRTMYHEIGFYFLASLDESLVSDGFKSLDGDGSFVWININQLEKYKILAKPIMKKVSSGEISDNNLEHIIYHEGEIA